MLVIVTPLSPTLFESTWSILVMDLFCLQNLVLMNTETAANVITPISLKLAKEMPLHDNSSAGSLSITSLGS